MQLAQDAASWGPLAVKLASAVTLTAALVVLLLAWRNNRRK